LIPRPAGDLTFLTSAAKVLQFLNPRLSRVSLVDILSDIRKSVLASHGCPIGFEGWKSKAEGSHRPSNPLRAQSNCLGDGIYFK